VIKVVFCLRRAEGLSFDDFQRYWHEQHGPLVARLAPVLGIRRYVQARPVRGRTNEVIGITRGSPEPFDGVAEIYFDNMEALRATTATKEAKDAEQKLRIDEAKFINLSQSPFFAVELHEMYKA
jgi:uncharacterized protein (TIGR02118 family)